MEDKAIECTSGHFKLYKNYDFQFSYDHYKFQEMTEKRLKCHCINLYLKLNSDLPATNLQL
jgi:hypothetical protein